MIWTWLLLACGAEPPAPLPPSILAAEAAAQGDGRMVAVTGVRGYLARPREPALPCPGVVVLVDQIDEAARAEARERAAKGEVLLLIEADTDAAAARRYLAGMSRTTEVTERCAARRCADGGPTDVR